MTSAKDFAAHAKGSPINETMPIDDYYRLRGHTGMLDYLYSKLELRAEICARAGNIRACEEITGQLNRLYNLIQAERESK